MASKHLVPHCGGIFENIFHKTLNMNNIVAGIILRLGNSGNHGL
jgi:hypothetical protein